jgi:hypothetical protein
MTRTARYFTDVDETDSIYQALSKWIDMYDNVHEVSIKRNMNNFTIFIKYEDEVEEARRWE